MKQIVLAVIITASFAPAPSSRLQTSCGITPMKPIVPIGCKDLVATCVCDAKGRNCHYVWVCVEK